MKKNNQQIKSQSAENPSDSIVKDTIQKPAFFTATDLTPQPRAAAGEDFPVMSYAQSTNSGTSSSSAAAAIVKLGETPVSHSLGSTDITIPLYTVQCGSLELPITLSYNCSGIKVGDIAGPAGLGWTLNTGGTIVREIRGAQDRVGSDGNIICCEVRGYSGSFPQNEGGQIVDYGIKGTNISNLNNFSTSNTEQVLDLAEKSIGKDCIYDNFYYSYLEGNGSFRMDYTNPAYLEKNTKEIWMDLKEDLKLVANEDKLKYSVELRYHDKIPAGKNGYDVYYYSSLNNFQIKSNIGNTYTFGDIGSVRSGKSKCPKFNDDLFHYKTPFASAPVSNTWGITEIESADKKHRINFDYVKLKTLRAVSIGNDFKYSKAATDADNIKFKKQFPETWWGDKEVTLSWASYQSSGVSKIEFNGNSIEFLYIDDSRPSPVDDIIQDFPNDDASFNEPFNTIRNQRLAEIIVKNYDGKIIRRIVFDNFSGQPNIMRYKLNGIKFYDGDNKLFDEYNFSYYGIRAVNDVKFNPNSQDHFGYNNGKDNSNLHFIHLYKNDKDFAGQSGIKNKRDYSFNSAQIDSLKEIKRISGAKTEFVYEANNHKDAGSRNINIGIRIKNINYYDSDKLVRSKAYTYEKSGTTIDFSKIDYSWFIERKKFKNVDTGEVTDNIYVYPYSIVPGVSMEEAKVFYGKVTETDSDIISGKSLRTVYEYDTSDWKYEYVSAQYKKPVRASGEEWKYQDIQDYVNSVPEQPSTGTNYYVGEIKGYFKYKPIYFGNLTSATTYETLADGTFKPTEKQEFQYTKYNNRNILTGNYIKNMVTMKYDDIPRGCQYKKEDNKFYWGYEKTVDKNKTEVVYDFENYMKSVPADCYCFNLDENHFLYKLKRHTVTKYIGGKEKLSYTDYRYTSDMSTYYQWPCTPFGSRNESSTPTELSRFSLRSTYTVSDSESTTHRYLYPNDYKDAACLDMDNSVNNMKNVCIGEEIKSNIADKASTVVGYQKVSKSSTDGTSYNIYRPYRSATVLGAETLSEKTTSRFDSYGNQAYIIETGQADLCYIWGYKNMYPVAEIRNATYDQVLTAMGGEAKITEIAAAGSVNSYLTLLNELREKLPEAQVTTYTYTPLVGITSSTDAAGRTQTFHYDGAGRMAAARDEEGNIIETFEYGTKQ